MIKNKEPIELQIPSKLGFEKIAAGCAVSIAKDMKFFPSKIDDLKTAVTEACLNAIEHNIFMWIYEKRGTSMGFCKEAY